MEAEESTGQLPNVSCKMEIQGMRHFFVLMVFAGALFVILTTIGVLTSRSKSFTLPFHERDRDLRRRDVDNDTMVNSIKRFQNTIAPDRSVIAMERKARKKDLRKNQHPFFDYKTVAPHLQLNSKERQFVKSRSGNKPHTTVKYHRKNLNYSEDVTYFKKKSVHNSTGLTKRNNPRNSFNKQARVPAVDKVMNVNKVPNHRDTVKMNIMRAVPSSIQLEDNIHRKVKLESSKK